MAMAQDGCGHEGCGCADTSVEGFCSEHCRDHSASGPTGEPCGCGHPECQAA